MQIYKRNGKEIKKEKNDSEKNLIFTLVLIRLKEAVISREGCLHPNSKR